MLKIILKLLSATNYIGATVVVYNDNDNNNNNNKKKKKKKKKQLSTLKNSTSPFSLIP